MEVSDDGEMILNILLNNPKDYLGEKPSAMRENVVFTLDSKAVPLESAKAEDNGPYIRPIIIENSKTGGFGILLAKNLEILFKNWRSSKHQRGVVHN